MVAIERRVRELRIIEIERKPNGETRTPIIYQLNTLPFRDRIIRDYQLPHDTPITDLPEEVWQDIKDLYHPDYLYLCGTAPESPYARQIAQKYAADHLRNMTGLNKDDLRGSPYARLTGNGFHPLVAKSDEEFGRFSSILSSLGMSIIIDEVPNHSSVDTTDRELLMTISVEQYHALHPDQKHNFYLPEGSAFAIALGKEFGPQEWIDTAQHALHRKEVLDILLQRMRERAQYCGGYRFDMAHLATLEGFKKAWGWTGIRVEDEEYLSSFWSRVYEELHSDNPGFFTIAEAYHTGGIDFVTKLMPYFDGIYDKGYYDLLHGVVRNNRSVMELRQRLQDRLSSRHRKKHVRFLQNHDEPPATSFFGEEASLALMALQIYEPSGTLMIQDAQVMGLPYRMPIQVSRYPEEPRNKRVHDFITTELNRRNTSDIMNFGEVSLLSTTADTVVGFVYEYERQGVAICINVREHGALGHIFLGENSHIRTVISANNKKSIAQFDKRTDNLKFISLDPYEVQIITFQQAE